MRRAVLTRFQGPNKSKTHESTSKLQVCDIATAET